MTKAIKYFFQSVIVYLLFLIGRILGLTISRKLFAALFVFFGPILRSNKIAEKNLKIIDHKISNDEIKKIIENMWKNYGITFIEYIYLKYFHKNNSYVNVKDEGNLLQIIKENKPVIFVSGHFANFELMSMEITKQGIPLATVYRPLNNFFLNPFMEFLRKKYICKNQIKKGIGGVRESIDYLKKKNSIALMIDQRVSEGEKIEFFNKSAFTTTLPAQLSIKFNIDILPVYIERDRENNYKIEFQKRIQPKDFANKLDLTKKLNRVLEKMVVRNLYQWILTHNRWK
jgi:KDO2-lipid IV(A) lauroyltransferase|tara:strand:+ start:5197 stop:6054 length:858 start_codon:yes stop_codon:yes gene_type:complete